MLKSVESLNAKMKEIKRALVFAAHPDDEVLGCGGTIARLAGSGTEVHIVILATGLTSRPDFDSSKRNEQLQIHHDRSRSAGALLGAASVKILGYPDQLLDSLPLLEINHALEKEIHAVQPDTVFTQHGGDLNLDHSILYRSTLTATRPVRGCTVKRVYAYEVASSTEWSFQRFEPRFQPSVFVNIEATLMKKIAAMMAYESEVREFPHPRSEKALTAAALRWGSVIGAPAAEAFELVREVHL